MSKTLLTNIIRIRIRVKITIRPNTGIEAFLGGVPLTTNVLYDPVGPLEPSGTPSGHSCPPQLQLGRVGGIRTGRVLTGF